jgi:translation initiation factor IF-3
MSRDEALQSAREQGLDLIEIAPNAKPPVARIISFDKYRYEKEKAEKKERQGQKGGSIKQVQISVRAAHNDLLVKSKRTDEFLSDNHPVEIRLRLRGREKAHPDFAREKLKKFLTMITIEHKAISDIRSTGNGLGITIINASKKI